MIRSARSILTRCREHKPPGALVQAPASSRMAVWALAWAFFSARPWGGACPHHPHHRAMPKA